MGKGAGQKKDGAAPESGKNVRWPVSRVLYPEIQGGDHSSRMPVTRHLVQPTRTAFRKQNPPLPCKQDGACRSYLVLLPVGFTVPPLLPGARCALTAPFHPYLALAGKAVCFLWHFPWGRPRRALPGTVFSWSPDFPLPAGLLRRTAAARPSDPPRDRS